VVQIRPLTAGLYTKYPLRLRVYHFSIS